MKRFFSFIFLAVMLTMSVVSCRPDIEPEEPPQIETPAPEPEPEPEPEPDPEPDPGPNTPSYDNLSAYGPLKSYVNRTVSPDFKLGAAIPMNEFFTKSSMYELALENYDEITPENAFKHASVVRSDGTMDFSTVRRTIEETRKVGLTVYGHTLAWHSQQTSYLKHIIKGKRVELPPSERKEEILLALVHFLCKLF